MKKILILYICLWDNIRAEILAAAGMFIIGLSLAYQPKAGTIYDLWGESASLFYSGVFLAGAATSLLAMRTSPLLRPIVIALATLPFLGYAVLTAYFFACAQCHDGQISLIAPLSYVGLFLVFQKLVVEETKYDDLPRKDTS